jgi:hypothetical protein
MAVKQPASKDMTIKSFFKEVKKGGRAMPARTERALVAAEAGKTARP